MSQISDNEFQLESFSSVPKKDFWVQAGVRRVQEAIKFYFKFGGDQLNAVKELGRSVQYGLLEDQRRDELWKTTCFELFLSYSSDLRGDVKASATYQEVNLSPNGSWNIYEFEDVRKGMKRSLNLMGFPLSLVQVSFSKSECTLEFPVPASHRQASLLVKFGTTAVIDISNQSTHWAMVHNQNKPDFHDKSSWLGQFYV